MKSAQFIGELYQRTISHVRIDKRLISGASDFKIALFSGQYFAVDCFLSCLGLTWVLLSGL